MDVKGMATDGKIREVSQEKVKQKTYTFDEAFKSSKEYFGGDELAARVWANKYALKDS